MADAKKVSKPKGANAQPMLVLNPKVMLAAAGIALISSLSSFLAIRLAMPRQIIIEKVTHHDDPTKAKARAEVPGPVLPAGDFVVNLAGGHFLKTSVTLQLAVDPKKKGGGEGDDPKAEFAPYLPIYKDGIIAVLSRKTAADLSSAVGKEAVKGELMSVLNDRVAAKKVTGVFFTDFVIE